MIETNRRIARRAIAYPTAGLISTMIGVVFGNSSSYFNIHSGEGLIWLSGVTGFLIILPAICLARSIHSLKLVSQHGRSAIRTYSMVLTVSLGMVLSAVVLYFLWSSLT